MRKLFVLVMAFFLMVSCAPKEEGKKAADGGYLMTIGDRVITEEDIRAIPDRKRHRYVGPGGLDRFIAEQILYQEALKKGLDKDPEYLKTVEYLKKKALAEILLDREIAGNVQVTDQELLDYYNKNKEEFTIKETGRLIEFDSIKENLRQVLLMEKKKTLFDKYMEDLRKRYKVEIKDEAMERAVKMLSEGK
jgi:peptidyl-prolyl cis-trans isomerase C